MPSWRSGSSCQSRSQHGRRSEYTGKAHSMKHFLAKLWHGKPKVQGKVERTKCDHSHDRVVRVRSVHVIRRGHHQLHMHMGGMPRKTGITTIGIVPHQGHSASWARTCFCEQKNPKQIQGRLWSRWSTSFVKRHGSWATTKRKKLVRITSQFTNQNHKTLICGKRNWLFCCV